MDVAARSMTIRTGGTLSAAEAGIDLAGGGA